MWECLTFPHSIFLHVLILKLNWGREGGRDIEKGKYKHNPTIRQGRGCDWKEKKRICRCKAEKKGLKRRMSVREKAGLGNYWTRLCSWGILSGTRGPRWWGCGKRDHMERGWWLCSLKLMTRLLPSPWAESEMRLARPNVLHTHHLCHKTNLITVNYGAAIIRR